MDDPRERDPRDQKKEAMRGKVEGNVSLPPGSTITLPGGVTASQEVRPPVPVTHGEPDFKSAQPQSNSPTVMTSGGKLDAVQVEHNRVGGTGVVHVHAAGPPMTEEQKKEAGKRS